MSIDPVKGQHLFEKVFSREGGFFILLVMGMLMVREFGGAVIDIYDRYAAKNHQLYEQILLSNQQISFQLAELNKNLEKIAEAIREPKPHQHSMNEFDRAFPLSVLYQQFAVPCRVALTDGSTEDSNVVINERMQETQGPGKSRAQTRQTLLKLPVAIGELQKGDSVTTHDATYEVLTLESIDSMEQTLLARRVGDGDNSIAEDVS